MRDYVSGSPSHIIGSILCLVWRKFSFTPVTTQKIRVVVNAGADNVYSRLVEVEAYGAEPPQGGQGEVNWLVSDHLGTPRMIADLSGSLAGIKRHDYLPFGEELGAGVGGRTSGQGYSQFDGMRVQFTGQERDNETGLDYMKARYYSSTQGRFTSVDPSSKSIIPTNPQTWNRYSYTYNNPLRYVDKNGKWPTETHNKLIDAAFPGLSASERRQIAGASENVDVMFAIHLPGTKYPVGWYSTLLPRNAPQHAMTPEGWKESDARKASQKWIDGNAIAFLTCVRVSSRSV